MDLPPPTLAWAITFALPPLDDSRGVGSNVYKCASICVGGVSIDLKISNAILYS